MLKGSFAEASVGDLMRPCSVFVSSHDLITKARSVMRSMGMRSLPVIDGGRLVGILTDKQIMRITSTRSNIPVAGLMLSPQVIALPTQDLARLAREMVELEISNVPVVQSPSDKVVMGVIGLDDILKRVSKSIGPEVKVSAAMSRKVVTCSTEDEISHVWNLMENTRCSGLPVTRYERKKRGPEVIGVITRSDIIRSGTVRLGEESYKGGRLRSAPRVRALMRPPAITIGPDAPLADAIELMLRRNVGRLPVVERGILVGILTRGDAIRAWVR